MPLIDMDRLIIDILDSPRIKTDTIPGLLRVICKQPAVGGLVRVADVKALIRSGISTDTEADQAYVCERVDDLVNKTAVEAEPNCGAHMEAEE